MKNNTGVYLFLAGLTIVVLVGFYIVFQQLNALQQLALENVPGSAPAAQATSTPTSTPAGGPSPASSSTAGSSTQPAGGGQTANAVSIPTGIIFSTLSSPVLQPQTNVTITVESVSKSSDGTVTVRLKAFTDQATSYSAVNPADFLALVNLTTGNQSVVSTTGNWNSMPPKGVVTGTAVFKTDPNATSVILQIGPPNSVNYYQFDFTTQSYKQVTLG